ncbi:FAD:protein FMN transferase [Butyrivibrio sp. JL13D10]|uniref:FAD:protein FMN transferase n=1 Tax=Butyrivibrio sp. JL13D10 TaxID=3236815 RepID=UPI0038B6243B
MSVFMSIYVFLTSCGMQTDNKSMEQVGFFFDTVVTFTAYYKDFTSSDSSFFTRYSDAEKSCSEFLDECQKACARYDLLFSTTKEGGDIWNINHSGGAQVEVDVDTYRLMQKALYYAELSDGAFDPTIGTVTDLWNFHADTDKAVPDSSSLQEALSHVDYRKVILSEKNEKYYVQLSDKDSRIDLGGIAKGYIADKLKELYISKGAKSGIINLGGNVLLIGSKPSENGTTTFYTTGVQRPFGDSNDPIVKLSLEDCSVVTSGIYDRFFEKDGQIYHHILNAKNGMPVENNIFSATIVSESSADGDALSTISYMLGTEKGMELINSIPDTYVLYVTDKYEIVSSENFPGIK